MSGFRCVMAGICGGSAAGKTTVAQSLASRLGHLHPTVVEVDRYYYDRSALSREQKRAINYDEPAAIEFSLLAAHLAGLKQGRAVEAPVYDYATHARLARVDRLKPSRLVIVEGVLLFSDPASRALLDFTIFVHAGRDERLRRRIARDAVERGRDRESVIRQFNETVEPGFERYIQPTKTSVDVVLDWNMMNHAALETIARRIEELTNSIM